MRLLHFGILALLLAVAGSLLAQNLPPARMEIVSRLGRQAKVKIYSGEAVTFRTREVREGMDGIFESGRFLYGVTFTLREWPKVDQDALAIVKGVNRRVVFTKKPGDELWGQPPSWVTIESGKPGRYHLEAAKPGYVPVRIVVHLARFEIVKIDAQVSENHYSASFDLRLIDPDEEGGSIPVRIETLDAEGRVVDHRRDLLLAPVALQPGEYHMSRRVRLSSSVVESFADRVARRKEAPLPPEFLDRKSLRIVEGGTVRISFRSVHAVYPLPFGYQ